MCIYIYIYIHIKHKENNPHLTYINYRKYLYTHISYNKFSTLYLEYRSMAHSQVKIETLQQFSRI